VKSVSCKLWTKTIANKSGQPGGGHTAAKKKVAKRRKIVVRDDDSDEDFHPSPVENKTAKKQSFVVSSPEILISDSD
jgi:hypothetical protein